MTDENDFDLKQFLTSILELCATQLAEMNEPLTAEVLTRVVVERLTTPQIKSKLTLTLEPFVQAWLDGRQ